jgi:amino acid adenylation domain-containing protein
MRTNSVYVPLNAKVPAERLAAIFGDACIDTVVIDTVEGLSVGVADALRRSRPLNIITRDALSGSALEALLANAPQHRLLYASVENPADEVSNDVDPETPRLAYIIYTSGSTGIPKGVAITQASAYQFIEKSFQVFHTCEADRFTQFSALSFDVSILDLFLCWKSGASLHVPDASEALLPLSFTVEHAITVWSSVPSLSNMLRKLRLLRPNLLPGIRLSLFCGEALPSDLAQDWAAAAPQSKVINLYGPTECTVFATFHELDRHQIPSWITVPIGAPLPGLSCMVVDDGRPVEAVDVPGELWLSGDQLALGYWNNPGATKAAFVRYPADDPGATLWYRTGDLVSYTRDDGLLYRGRIDRQVKLLGHRIELQEVEAALRAVIGCALVAVVPIRNSGGICEKLIAYCDQLHADEATIKARCLSRIPRYMLPERIIQLEAFPFSSHGKVDYPALASRAAAAAV